MVPAEHESIGNHPAGIGGYAVRAELTPGQSYLAVAPGGRDVLLKVLDPDCLLVRLQEVKLHPNVRDRLARVRELAHAGVANLYGVERDPQFGGGIASLIWEHIPGKTLEDWAAMTEVAPPQLLLVARELILTVAALHGRGIVHGALHGRNVIVTPEGRLRLTHVSPLLYADPRHDLACIAELFRELASRRGSDGAALEALAREADQPEGNLRSMGSRAASIIDRKREEMPSETSGAEDAQRRRASRLTAVAVVALAVLISYGIRQYVNAMTPKAPVPPIAPPGAVEP